MAIYSAPVRRFGCMICLLMRSARDHAARQAGRKPALAASSLEHRAPAPTIARRHPENPDSSNERGQNAISIFLPTSLQCAHDPARPRRIGSGPVNALPAVDLVAEGSAEAANDLATAVAYFEATDANPASLADKVNGSSPRRSCSPRTSRT